MMEVISYCKMPILSKQVIRKFMSLRDESDESSCTIFLIITLNQFL